MSALDGDFFDPVEEVYSRFGGETYGLPRATFTRLAYVALSLARAGVGPASIARRGSGGPGCDLVIYGNQTAYTVRIELSPDRLSLYGIGLDAHPVPLTPGRLLFAGQDSFRDWFRVNNFIRIHEKIENQTFAEVDEAFGAQEDCNA